MSTCKIYRTCTVLRVLGEAPATFKLRLTGIGRHFSVLPGFYLILQPLMSQLVPWYLPLKSQSFTSMSPLRAACMKPVLPSSAGRDLAPERNMFQERTTPSYTADSQREGKLQRSYVASVTQYHSLIKGYHTIPNMILSLRAHNQYLINIMVPLNTQLDNLHAAKCPTGKKEWPFRIAHRSIDN